MKHTLLIGCTGMLREAAVELASQSRVVSSVARTDASLAALDSELSRFDCTHHMLALDWNTPDIWLRSIITHLQATDPPDLVVAWIHDPDLGYHLAREIAGAGHHHRFFQVLGSQSLEFPQLPSWATESYHQVILGAIRQADGFRWLTHREISDGVLAAVESGGRLSVVGGVAGRV